MPTEMSVQSIFNLVSEEKLGFSFGKPDRPSVDSLACILPILRKTTQKRQYITFPETEEVIATDSGSINKINLKNTSKENVFVRSSTIFQGKGTQSRVLMRSAILFPGQEVALDCRCIHRSHGIHSGSGFAYGGITPTSVESSSYSAGFTPRDQHTVWSAVDTVSNTMCSMQSGTTFRMDSGVMSQGEPISPSGSRLGRTGTAKIRGRRGGRTGRVEKLSVSMPRETTFRADANVPFTNRTLMADGSPEIFTAQFGGEPYVPNSDNLKANFDAFAQNFDDILSKARLHDNQVGLALITQKGCQTIELFDVDQSWEAIHKDSVKRMGTELLRGPDNTNVFEYKPENAVNAVRAVLALPFKTNLIYEHKPSNGEPTVSIFGLTAQRFVGEAVEIDGRVMHLVVLETAQ